MVDKATNIVMNYTETESKVREATNDDPWGPSGTIVRYPVPAYLNVWKHRIFGQNPDMTCRISG